jgi:hypothetical protein
LVCYQLLLNPRARGFAGDLLQRAEPMLEVSQQLAEETQRALFNF